MGTCRERINQIVEWAQKAECGDKDSQFYSESVQHFIRKLPNHGCISVVQAEDILSNFDNLSAEEIREKLT